jgi:LacI family transcriptional regulator
VTGKAGRVVRLAEVAEAAGVGVSNTSRVLNGDPTVSRRTDTRERVLAAARRLDYRPNAIARGLRLSRTMTIGIVIDLAFYSENAAIMTAAERAAAEAGFVLLIADTNEFVERGDVYRHMLRERRVDGVLIASVAVSDAFIDEIAGEGLPFVVLNRGGRVAGASVAVDEAAGLRLAVEHLASLGHARIGYVAGPVEGTQNRRLRGFGEGLRAAGLRAPARLVVPCASNNDGAFDAAVALLRQRSRPTAVCVWSATGAVAVLAAAKHCGLAVPGDLSIVAYNDSSLMQYLDPPITTVRMPLDALARRAVQDLLSVIDGGRTGSVLVEEPAEIVLRGSTAAPRRERTG